MHTLSHIYLSNALYINATFCVYGRCPSRMNSLRYQTLNEIIIIIINKILLDSYRIESVKCFLILLNCDIKNANKIYIAINIDFM